VDFIKWLLDLDFNSGIVLYNLANVNESVLLSLKAVLLDFWKFPVQNCRSHSVFLVHSGMVPENTLQLLPPYHSLPKRESNMCLSFLKLQLCVIVKCNFFKTKRR
jgi:hypothetical protein